MRTFTRIALTLGLLLTTMFSLTPTAFAQGGEAPVVRITQVDNSQFPQVTVYVSVTNAAGEPLAVDAATIQLFENGVLMQTINITGTGTLSAPTTLFVIDVSGSMEKSEKMNAAKEAAKAYVNQMRPGDQGGLIAFNTEVNILQPVTADHQALTQAIDSLYPNGNTAMFDALLEGVNLLAGIPGRKAILLLSDGLDNRSLHSVDDVIESIGPAGLSISTIGLGDPKEAGTNYGLDEPALRSLAERAGGTYSFATDPTALTGIYEQEGRVLQSEYAFTYTSPSTLRDGINRALTVSLNNGTVTAASQYNPGGVLPEVGSRSLPLFGGILLGLVALLALPTLVGWGLGAVGGRRKKSRVRLKDPAPQSPQKRSIRMK
jgi:VWFA-related protein